MALYAGKILQEDDSTLTRRISITWNLCAAMLMFFGGDAMAAASELEETAGAMRAWHNTDGLPSDSVTAIIQTRDGFLWIGTSAGLVRFDGVKFTQLKLSASATNNFPGITALCEDDAGHLWIGTQADGLFELASGTMQHFSEAKGLLDNNVTSLAADDHEAIWIGTKSGLDFWSGKNFKSFTTQNGLSDDFISGVHVARSGTVWITTRNGMCRYLDGHIASYEFQTESQGRSPEYLGAYEDRRGNLWAFGDTYLINLAEGKRFNYFRSSESASVRIWSLCEGRDGRIWIGTSGRGLFCFEDNSFQPVNLGENRSPYDVRAIYEDREGNLWLGTSGGGLLQLRPQSIHVLRAEQGLPASLPTALAQAADGKIYVGLQRGGLFAGESGRFDHVDANDGLALQNFISSAGVTRDGTVWAGTLGNGLFALKNDRGMQFTTANGLADNTVLAVCVDTESNVWASTGAGTIHRFDAQNNVARFDATQNAPVTAMISAASGGLWLGTQDGKIWREENGKFSRVAALKNLEGFPVLALFESEKNELWIGSAGGGLARLADGAAMNWNTHSGLPNDLVAGIVEDKAKKIWLATGAGIYRINRSNIRKSLDDRKTPLACELMSEVKTVPDSTTIFGGTRALLSPDGALWFATSEGVLNVDTHSTEVTSPEMPLFLENAIFNSEPPVDLLRGGPWLPPVKNAKPLRAPVDLRSLEIHFTALSFAAPEEVRFRHKLDGADADWQDDGNVRSARYNRLLFGQYRFRVAAREADGTWQESPQTFSFIVPTPFYFQTWAICSYVFLAVALVAGIVRVISHRRLRMALARLEQQQSLERERMRIARDMHDEMGSKLTKISFLSERAQDETEAKSPLAGKIESIAQTSRELLKTMDEIVWVVNPHNDTLENLVAYLSHYAVEYFQNTSVECELNLSPQIPHHPLSSEVRHNLFLTFEEILNNVLKHSAATKVKVEMSVRAREFEVKISDNGSGFAVPDFSATNTQTRGGAGGNGLKNMRQRLASIGGECLISSQPGGGAVITMRIRLN
jgi:ligand-binding sensor domain-containing protein/signal transduction histidine kinase